MKDIATNISLCESGVRARGAGGGVRPSEARERAERGVGVWGF